jgi:hypothetical protein
MTRKLTLALAAAAAIGAAALTPTAASAWGHGHGHGHHGFWRGGYGIGYYGPTYVAGPDCYLVKRQVQLDDGSWRWRRFTVCN